VRSTPEPDAPARPTERLDLRSPTATRLAALAARQGTGSVPAQTGDRKAVERTGTRPVVEPPAAAEPATGAQRSTTATGSHPAAAARAGVAAARAAAKASRTGQFEPVTAAATDPPPAPEGDLFGPAAPRAWPWAPADGSAVPRGAQTRPMPAAVPGPTAPADGPRSRHSHPGTVDQVPPAPVEAPRRGGRHHRRDPD
jgi:hypothetical protein